MKYKAEVLHQSVVKAEFYPKKLSHPEQVVRNVIEKVRGKLNYFIVLIANDVGDVWKYSVRKNIDGKFYVRKIGKSMINKDQVDMVFTGNMPIERFFQ